MKVKMYIILYNSLRFKWLKHRACELNLVDSENSVWLGR